MRVLIGPLAEARLHELASDVAIRLAGPAGTMVSLRKNGVPDLSRLLSRAEVVRLREAMLGAVPRGQSADAGVRDDLVGYVCSGSLLTKQTETRASVATALIAVTDHADLTWRSPLTGPNDEVVGPRFPSMTGIYASQTVGSRLGLTGHMLDPHLTRDGMIMIPGVVAGVKDDSCLSDHEAEIAQILACAGASSELAPVAVVAAHLGLKVAAAVVTLIE